MNKEPKVIEKYADNGEFSHYQLINENGEILWSEDPSELYVDLDCLSCICGNRTYTHRHSNWIECTVCHKIKFLK